MTGWREQAACLAADTDVFYPARSMPATPAKRICAGCPVREPCLEYALANDEEFGVWGGLSERARRRLRSAMGEEAA